MTTYNRQVLDEAAEWFVAFREGEVDTAAKANFSRWLRRSPEHIEAYLEIAAFWEDVPEMVPRDSLDIEALIAEARAEGNVVALTSPVHSPSFDDDHPAAAKLAAAKRSFRLTDRLILIAASVCVVCTGAAGIAWHLLHQGVYTTDLGEQRMITLEDATTIELNAKTRLRVRLEPRARNVELLEGQALFHVSKDPGRPFIVRSGGISVRAVGTEFDVYKKDSGATIITVVEGRVAVSSSSGDDSGSASGATHSAASSFLAAGEQITVIAQAPASVQAADISAATAWTKRQIVFQSTPLSDVVEEFNRYNRRQLIIEDPTLRTIRVSGVFSSTEPGSLLRFLRDQLQLSVNNKNDRIEIGRH